MEYLDYEAYVQMGLDGEAPLKVIMSGAVMERENENRHPYENTAF